MRYVLVFLIFTVNLCSFAEAQSDEPIRVLIVTGEDYPGHKWRETTPVIREILERQPYFSVTVSEDVEILAAHPEKRYDTMVLHFCNWESPMPSEEARRGLVHYMESGKGLVVLHFACGAFREWPNYHELAWPEYEYIIGRVWDTQKTHDPYQEFEVNIKDSNHPITKGIDDFITSDELYFCLEGDPEIDVLMTAHSTITKQDEPMGFVLEYKGGRVFHTPLGHDVKSYQAPEFQALLQRACEWTASGGVERYSDVEK